MRNRAYAALHCRRRSRLVIAIVRRLSTFASRRFGRLSKTASLRDYNKDLRIEPSGLGGGASRSWSLTMIWVVPARRRWTDPASSASWPKWGLVMWVSYWALKSPV